MSKPRVLTGWILAASAFAWAAALGLSSCDFERDYQTYCRETSRIYDSSSRTCMDPTDGGGAGGGGETESDGGTAGGGGTGGADGSTSGGADGSTGGADGGTDGGAGGGTDGGTGGGADGGPGGELDAGAGPTEVSLNVPMAAWVGTCSSGTVSTQDSRQPVPVQQPTQIFLSSNPSAGFSFYSGTSCSGPPISSVVLAPGQSEASISVRSSYFGPYTLYAEADGGALSMAMQDQFVIARLVYRAAPDGGTAGVCTSAFVIQAQDMSGRPAEANEIIPVDVTSDSPSTDFYDDPACSFPLNGQFGVPTVYIGQFDAGATFYLRDSVPGMKTITVQNAYLQPAMHTFVLSDDDGGYSLDSGLEIDGGKM